MSIKLDSFRNYESLQNSTDFTGCSKTYIIFSEVVAIQQVNSIAYKLKLRSFTKLTAHYFFRQVSILSPNPTKIYKLSLTSMNYFAVVFQDLIEDQSLKCSRAIHYTK